MSGKVRKRNITKHEQQTNGNEKANLKSRSVSRGSHGILIILFMMVAITWGIAASAYFGLVDYKALIVHGTSVSTSDIMQYTSALYPSQYEALRHPVRSLGEALIYFDDLIFSLFVKKEKTSYIDKRRVVVFNFPLEKHVNSIKDSSQLYEKTSANAVSNDDSAKDSGFSKDHTNDKKISGEPTNHVDGEASTKEEQPQVAESKMKPTQEKNKKKSSQAKTSSSSYCILNFTSVEDCQVNFERKPSAEILDSTDVSETVQYLGKKTQSYNFTYSLADVVRAFTPPVLNKHFGFEHIVQIKFSVLLLYSRATVDHFTLPVCKCIVSVKYLKERLSIDSIIKTAFNRQVFFISFMNLSTTSFKNSLPAMKHFPQTRSMTISITRVMVFKFSRTPVISLTCNKCLILRKSKVNYSGQLYAHGIAYTSVINIKKLYVKNFNTLHMSDFSYRKIPQKFHSIRKLIVHHCNCFVSILKQTNFISVHSSQPSMIKLHVLKHKELFLLLPLAKTSSKNLINVHCFSYRSSLLLSVNPLPKIAYILDLFKLVDVKAVIPGFPLNKYSLHKQLNRISLNIFFINKHWQRLRILDRPSIKTTIVSRILLSSCCICRPAVQFVSNSVLYSVNVHVWSYFKQQVDHYINNFIDLMMHSTVLEKININGLQFIMIKENEILAETISDYFLQVVHKVSNVWHMTITASIRTSIFTSLVMIFVYHALVLFMNVSCH
ncbi:uncharacterized protein LOC143446056 isoform X1 [Clavelina lepadiformis]|uniref:uncharacterized protein LOC143446056 isoform X1 n=1 Tax=Clavelina lepadiformis TaxID=159417 RepID=UPI0040414064